MDVQKQIEYWRKGGEEDFEAARSLLEKGHPRHALFFAHLAVEKLLKAHVTRQTAEVPPRIHNLIRLAEIAQLTLRPEQAKFLRGFGLYQLEGRYPDADQATLDPETARKKLSLTEEMLEWLKAQL